MQSIMKKTWKRILNDLWFEPNLGLIILLGIVLFIVLSALGWIYK